MEENEALPEKLKDGRLAWFQSQEKKKIKFLLGLICIKYVSAIQVGKYCSCILSLCTGVEWPGRLRFKVCLEAKLEEHN